MTAFGWFDVQMIGAFVVPIFLLPIALSIRLVLMRGRSK